VTLAAFTRSSGREYESTLPAFPSATLSGSIFSRLPVRQQSLPNDYLDYLRLKFKAPSRACRLKSKTLRFLVIANSDLTIVSSALLFHRGIVNIDLATCVPTIATWSPSHVPKFLPAERIQ
jgi:hypothetical protein